ncbi:helix-turn-helix domain-containing protein [Flexivirga alba]|uniref:Helix-turn-helix domain-containing protein n=1 Tax=Flexivirga alba TaxID=702742 RepID=A0ABW2AJ23_9MICO
MSTYREWRLCAGVTAWSSTSDGSVERVLPDGCLDLIWHSGRLLVAGPDTTATVAQAPPGVRWVGLRFASGVGPAALGTPADELTDRFVPLTDVWARGRRQRIEDTAARLGESPASDETVAGALMRELGPLTPDPLHLRVARLAASGAPMAALARSVDLSPRQFQRRSHQAFGYGPKRLHRIARFQRAWCALLAGGTPAETAAAQGFSDQAHLSREARILAGVTLSTLLAERAR